MSGARSDVHALRLAADPLVLVACRAFPGFATIARRPVRPVEGASRAGPSRGARVTDSRRIDAELLAILRCPRCRSTLSEGDGELVCTDPACAARYPVVDGIPQLVVDGGGTSA